MSNASLIVKIDGMSCQHCVRAVQKELGRVPGLQVEEVVIGSARVRSTDGQDPLPRVKTALERVGYEVVG